MPTANQYTNLEVLGAAIRRAETERTASLNLGDSNCFWQNDVTPFGYQRGIELAMRTRYGTHSAGPFPGSPENTTDWEGLVPGFESFRWGDPIIRAVQDIIAAPLLRDTLYPSGEYLSAEGASGPSNYARLDGADSIAGGTSGVASARGTIMRVDQFPINLSNGFTVHSRDANFSVGTGGSFPGLSEFNVVQAPETTYTGGGMIVGSNTNYNTITGTDELVDNSYVIPAGDYTGQDLFLRWGGGAAGNVRWNAPFFNLHQVIEDVSKTNGSMTSILLSNGGSSTKDMFDHFTDATGAYAAPGRLMNINTGTQELLRATTKQLGTDPTIIHYVWFVGNDFNVPLTPQQISANVDATFNKIKSDYGVLGVGIANMLFVPVVYQNWSVNTAEWQSLYDEYVVKFAGQADVCPTYFSMYLPQEIIDNGWSDNGVTTVHLNDAGYIALAEQFISDAVAAAVVPSPKEWETVANYNSSVGGNAITQFSRPAPTEDGALSDVRRFTSKDVSYTGSPIWTDDLLTTQQISKFIGSGPDADGTPLVLGFKSASGLVVVYELVNGAFVESSSTLYTALPGADGTISYRPRNCSIFHGLVVLTCDTYVSGISTYVTIIMSQDRGNFWVRLQDVTGSFNIPENSLQVAQEPGFNIPSTTRGNDWSGAEAYPVGGIATDGTYDNLNCWFAGADYIGRDFQAQSGTHTGANSSFILEDTTQNWAVDSMVGATLTNTTSTGSGEITSNTATTINASLAFNTGDTYTVSGHDPRGGLVYLFRASRPDVNSSWTTDKSRVLYEEWDLAHDSTHIHTAGMMSGGVVAVVGDSYGNQHVVYSALDLNDYRNAPITNNPSWCGNNSLDGTLKMGAPQPVAMVPGPGNSILSSSDFEPENILRLEDAAPSDLPIWSSVQSSVNDQNTGSVFAGYESLFMSWYPGFGWSCGGAGINAFTPNPLQFVSKDGLNWVNFPGHLDTELHQYIVGNKILGYNKARDQIQLADFPTIQTQKPLRLAPGGANLMTEVSSRRDPIGTNARNYVDWSVGSGYTYVVGGASVPGAPADPPPRSSSYLVEYTLDSPGDYDGGWEYLQALADTIDGGQNMAIDMHIFNLSKQGIPRTNEVYGPGPSDNDNMTNELGYRWYASKEWMPLPRYEPSRTTSVVDRAIFKMFAGEGFGAPNNQRFLIAYNGLYNGTSALPWPCPPDKVVQPNEIEKLTNLTASTSWTVAVVLHRPLQTSLIDVPLFTAWVDATTYVEASWDSVNDTIVITSTAGPSITLPIGLWLREIQLFVMVADDGVNLAASAYSMFSGIIHSTSSGSSLVSALTEIKLCSNDSALVNNMQVSNVAYDPVYRSQAARTVSIQTLDFLLFPQTTSPPAQNLGSALGLGGSAVLGLG